MVVAVRLASAASQVRAWAKAKNQGDSLHHEATRSGTKLGNPPAKDRAFPSCMWLGERLAGADPQTCS